MTDTPMVDQVPEPGDTFIVLRDGVPYIGTETVKATGELFLDMTALFLAKFDPHELRGPDGKWSLSGLEKRAGALDVRQRFVHQGHDVDRTANKGYRVRLKSGEVQHYDRPEDAAMAAFNGKHHTPGAAVSPEADLAARLNAGQGVGSTTEGRSFGRGVQEWTIGNAGSGVKKPNQVANAEDLKRFHATVAAAPANAPVLHRGLHDYEDPRLSASPESVAAIKAIQTAKPGDVIKTDQAASWSKSSGVADEFAGVNIYNDYVSTPNGQQKRRKRNAVGGIIGVRLQVEPNSRALNISKYAIDEFKYQKEWVSPPGIKYEVISNKPDPEVEGLRIVTVKEVQS